MNVTLRPDGHPDIYFDSKGHDLKSLETHIRLLLTARRWLKREQALREESQS